MTNASTTKCNNCLLPIEDNQETLSIGEGVRGNIVHYHAESRDCQESIARRPKVVLPGRRTHGHDD